MEQFCFIFLMGGEKGGGRERVLFQIVFKSIFLTNQPTSFKFSTKPSWYLFF